MGKKGFMFELRTLKKVFGVYISISRKYFTAVFVQAFLQSAVLMLYVFVPKLIIEGLTGKREALYFVIVAGSAAAANYIIGLVIKRLACYTTASSGYVVSEFSRRVAQKLMNTSFMRIEDAQFIEFKERALFPVLNRNVLGQLANAFPDLVQCIITIIGISAILAAANPLLILLLILTNLLCYMLNIKKQQRAVELTRLISSMNKEFSYLVRTIRSKESGRELRGYDASGFIMSMARDSDARMFKNQENNNNNEYGFDAVVKLVNALQNALAYGFIGVYSLVNRLGIGDFSMYLSAVNTFCNTTNKVLDLFVQLRANAKYLEDFIRLYEIETEESGTGKALPTPGKVEIAFKDVYFRYPNTENYVLNGVSFVISDRERISIVGRNGAGKTTIIKLLSRLYKPEKGEILLNGININEYGYAAYNRLLSVIFQDFKVFEFTIRENIALNAENGAALLSAMEKAGASAFVSQLRNEADTLIGTTFGKDGTELSGGQKQKIAIARAIFRDSGIVILDEPTSALDPIAEAETYEKLNAMISGKTAVYISHRLSSCKFCDRILFLSNGIISEQGSHDELMRRSGQYAEMFRLQADVLLTGKSAG